MQPFGIDHRITDAVVSSRSEPWTSLMQFITVWGDTLTLTLVVIAVVLLAWMVGRIDFAALIVVGSLTAWGTLTVLKVIFARDRPPIEDRLIDIAGLSFPSGHAMLSVVVYSLAAIILHRCYRGVRARQWWLLVVPVLIVLIGMSRIYLGVHWFSDVIGGWLLGLLWVSLCVAAHLQGAKRRQAARMSA